MQKGCKRAGGRAVFAALVVGVIFWVVPLPLVMAAETTAGGIQHGGGSMPEAVQMGIHEQSWASGPTRHELLVFPAFVVVLTVVLVVVLRKRKS